MYTMEILSPENFHCVQIIYFIALGGWLGHLKLVKAVDSYCNRYAQSLCFVLMNHNCSGFTNPPPLPCFTFSILFFIDGLRLGWWWCWRLVVGVLAASACSDHSFVSMQMYFSFNLVPQLIVFTASHITPKKLNLLDSEKKYSSHKLFDSVLTRPFPKKKITRSLQDQKPRGQHVKC